MDIENDNTVEGEAEEDLAEQEAQDVEDDDSNDSGVSNLKPTKQRANAWNHFVEIIENGVKYAKCKHCDK